jgi:hypothetical protein
VSTIRRSAKRLGYDAQVNEKGEDIARESGHIREDFCPNANETDLSYGHAFLLVPPVGF